MFEFLKKKKKRNVRMECVYAGPDQMARRAGQNPKKAETDRPPKPPVFNPDDFTMTTVYAGPGGSAMESVYAGPEDVTIEDVYGGPGMMDELGYEEPEDEETEAGEPEETAAPRSEALSAMEGVYAGPQPDPASMNFVYAGPQQPDPSTMMLVYAGPQQMNPSSMMFVYAGPDYFSNRKGAQAVPAPQDTAGPQAAYPQNYAVDSDEPYQNLRFCLNCGRLVQPGDKICECGYMLEEDASSEAAAADEKPQNDGDANDVELMNFDPPMAPVYAGPEYFNRTSV